MDQTVHAGQLYAMGLIDEASHVLMARYREQFDPQVMTSALDWFAAQPGFNAVIEAANHFGRFFTGQEDQHRMPVVVVGEDISKQLFPGTDPVGKWVVVDEHQLQIVGVMNRAAASLPGQDDKRVLIPYFTMRKIFPTAREHMLIVIAYPGKINQAQEEVRATLRVARP